jgi:hypothetical protein
MRLILQLCLLLLVLLSTATHALGKMAIGQNIASGGYGVVYVDCTNGDAPRQRHGVTNSRQMCAMAPMSMRM